MPPVEAEASVVAERASRETGPVETTGLVGVASVVGVTRALEWGGVKPSLVVISISSMRARASGHVQ